MARTELGEYFYKYAVLQKHVLSKSGSKRARVFFEFRAGRSKLDSLVARESLHAVEIKTDLDHFRRLPTQIHDYRRRFAHVWIFASERNAYKLEADKSLPSSVGIAFMSRRLTFSVIREAARDVSLLNSKDILECLQRSEYLEILRERGFDASGIPNTLLFSEAMQFAERLDPELVHEATLAQLKGRAHGVSAPALMRIPRYIRAAVVAAGCDDIEVEHLLVNLGKKVSTWEIA